jgi:glycine/D-amino acid oxidase-like deaminating enzyme
MTPLAHSARHPVAIVLGCGDVGSAVALALHQAGHSVVLVDEADPAWHRRGMTFTNASYVGNAELEGEGACFCASLKSIPSVISRAMIAATTWSWPGIAAALDPALLVDARGRKRRGSEVLRGRVPVAIGIGHDFVAGENVDTAIAPPAAPARGAGSATESAGAMDSTQRDPAGRSRLSVAAMRHGRFMTERRIGDAIKVNDIVGGLGNEIVRAPAAGVLLGLAARGARIEPGDLLVEVDPAGFAHQCYGVADGPRGVASDVLTVLASRRAVMFV